MEIVDNLIKKITNPHKKFLKMNKCLIRFENAYKDVSALLPETTVDSLIKQLSDQPQKG